MTAPHPAPAEALREALEAAKAGFDAMFRSAPQHREGCLFREDRRMPCQCGYNDRERAAMKNAERLCRDAHKAVTAALTQAPAPAVPEGAFPLGVRVQKIKGSCWHGRVVGYYRTKLTPNGICVESEREPGSVQIYPASALSAAPLPPKPE